MQLSWLCLWPKGESILLPGFRFEAAVGQESEEARLGTQQPSREKQASFLLVPISTRKPCTVLPTVLVSAAVLRDERETDAKE